MKRSNSTSKNCSLRFRSCTSKEICFWSVPRDLILSRIRTTIRWWLELEEATLSSRSTSRSSPDTTRECSLFTWSRVVRVLNGLLISWRTTRKSSTWTRLLSKRLNSSWDSKRSAPDLLCLPCLDLLLPVEPDNSNLRAQAKVFLVPVLLRDAPVCHSVRRTIRCILWPELLILPRLSTLSSTKMHE